MQLEEKRNEIDIIDASIVSLLNRRASLAREISVIKLSAGIPIADASREREVIELVAAATAEGSDLGAMERIFRVILRESRHIQARMLSEIAASGVRS
jgi:chorismate mutase / prephenate dehydratase